MTGQAALLQQLKDETDPAARRALALDLLAKTKSRQAVEAALHALKNADLGDEARPILREKTAYYFANPGKDSGATLREALIRLLAGIGHREDADLYQRGVRVYERKPLNDVTQTCRAAALVGLAMADRAACLRHAVRLLGEPDTSPLSGEPSLTAINVLARFDERLPIYGFLLLAGEGFVRRGLGELAGKALESLGADFPPDLYAALAEPFLAMDSPPVSAGVINHVVENRAADLYSLLADTIHGTRHADLRRFGLITVAAARDDTLTELLYEWAAVCPAHHVADTHEAVELSAHPDRDDVLAVLEKRLQSEIRGRAV